MRKFVIPILLIFAFVLSACSSTVSTTAAQTSAAQTTAAATSSTTAALSTDYDNAVSAAVQLAVGTINLNGTANAVSKDQATTLLTLWQKVQSSMQPSQMGGPNGSGQPGQTNGQNGSATDQNSATPQAAPTTAAATSSDEQTQLDTLIAQIESSMTADQINAIAAMKLTQDMVSSILQENGYTSSNQAGPASNTGSTSGNDNGASTQGTPPSGGQGAPSTGSQQQPPSGGQEPQGGQPNGSGQPSGNAPQQSGTDQNQASSSGQPTGGQPMGNGNMVQPEVVNAVIQYLANTAGVTLPTSQAPSDMSGQPNSGAPAANGGTSSAAITSVDATYTVDGTTASQSSQTYSASAQDTSAVFVTNDGKLTLTNPTISTTGNTSSTDNSSFYGLNAAVLVNQGAALEMSGGSVTSSGSGANGVFSSGTGSTVTLSNSTITATGDGGHAVMATQGGVMNISNVNMTTSGGSASAIATDRGGGTINVTGGTVKTSGNNSAGIYSTGAITVNGTTFTSTGAEVAVIEGANSITLTDTNLTSSFANKWAVMIYQSMSGDAEGSEGTFTMTGGSLTLSATSGPLFYVNNSTANILLKGVTLTSGSGIFLNAAAGNWGNSGTNGGNAIVTADGQTITGNIVVDKISTAKMTLQNTSVLTGAVNTDNSAKEVDLTLDATSIWNVTADSYITCLTDASGISGKTISNINGNGHTVYYNSASCPTLNGATYTLSGSGTLTPSK